MSVVIAVESKHIFNKFARCIAPCHCHIFCSRSGGHDDAFGAAAPVYECSIEVKHKSTCGLSCLNLPRQIDVSLTCDGDLFSIVQVVLGDWLVVLLVNPVRGVVLVDEIMQRGVQIRGFLPGWGWCEGGHLSAAEM